MPHNNEANGVAWKEVNGVARSMISSPSELEARSSMKLHPDMDRGTVTEDPSAREFGEGMAIFLASCK